MSLKEACSEDQTDSGRYHSSHSNLQYSEVASRRAEHEVETLLGGGLILLEHNKHEEAYSQTVVGKTIDTIPREV